MKTESTDPLKNVKFRLQLGFLSLGIILMSIACGSKKNTGSLNNLQDFEQLRDLINSRKFEVENDRAIPFRLTMVNLIGNPNFIRFKGDSVEVFLPYFGVRQSVGGYGGDGGIKYEGLTKNLNIVEDRSKNKILINFEGKQGTENLQFFMTLFPNRNANTSLNSSQRDPISYWGNVKALPDKNN